MVNTGQTGNGYRKARAEQPRTLESFLHRQCRKEGGSQMDWRVFREPDLIPAGELPPLLRPGDVPTAKPGQTESRLLPEVNRRFAVAVGADRRCPPPAGDR